MEILRALDSRERPAILKNKMKRTFKVNVSFDFDLDVDEMKEYGWKDWGYGRYPVENLSIQNVTEELRTCLSHEFARDEAGLSSLPTFDLTVKEVL